jgi:hypothetical protein
MIHRCSVCNYSMKNRFVTEPSDRDRVQMKSRLPSSGLVNEWEQNYQYSKTLCRSSRRLLSWTQIFSQGACVKLIPHRAECLRVFAPPLYLIHELRSLISKELTSIYVISVSWGCSPDQGPVHFSPLWGAKMYLIQNEMCVRFQAWM